MERMVFPSAPLQRRFPCFGGNPAAPVASAIGLATWDAPTLPRYTQTSTAILVSSSTLAVSLVSLRRRQQQQRQRQQQQLGARRRVQLSPRRVDVQAISDPEDRTETAEKDAVFRPQPLPQRRGSLVGRKIRDTWSRMIGKRTVYDDTLVASSDSSASKSKDRKPPPVVDLPITEFRDEIVQTMRVRRAMVIMGGTGCGKSTQVPKYFLEDADASDTEANILVTQPRRMAAVSLADRVAHERGEEVGGDVGYRIRGEVVHGRRLSFVTAGYLLSWFTAEPQAFANVTHLIIDEAHERSSDMELLLLLVRLLMRVHTGPRLVLMSATIQASFFAQYFKEFVDSPIVPLHVGQRIYPVQEYYLDDLMGGRLPGRRRLPAKVALKASVITRELFSNAVLGVPGGGVDPRVHRLVEELCLDILPLVAQPGSTVLVFVPGYSDLCKLHSKLLFKLPTSGSSAFQATSRLQDTPEKSAPEIDDDGEPKMLYKLFALHSQVPKEEQELTLEKPRGNICHVVLSTTVAESSITLPEVAGIIDFGLHRTTFSDPKQPGLIQLITQWCSKASATQRSGRAGRTRPGWCIRLISKDFDTECLTPYDTPEILRTPLTKLFLQAKGICDGLDELVKDNPDAARRLGVQANSPAALLARLPAPPEAEAINAAVRELALLGALTHESETAAVTALGQTCLGLPLDVRLCRLVWLGSLWGCVTEAVVLAAACGSPQPFASPSQFNFEDAEEFHESLRNTARSRRSFDGGHFSEPLMCLRLFCEWSRRLAKTSKVAPHQVSWFQATASLCEDEAIDTNNMARFIGAVADIALRAMEMCSKTRGEGACTARADLYRLVQLLRHPELSPGRRKIKTAQLLLEPNVKPGEVFRAPPSLLYALLGAAFSDQLLIGRHKIKTDKQLKSMVEALNNLPDGSGLSSQNAVLVPISGKRMHQEIVGMNDDLKPFIAQFSGEEPREVANTPAFIACHFPEGRRVPQPGASQAQAADMGLGRASWPRIAALAQGPQICYMGLKGWRYLLGGVQLSAPVSPYELHFNMATESVGNRRIAGYFDERNPIGFPCHIVSPEVPLGTDDFGLACAGLTLSNFGISVRADNTTLLTAEQLLYALTTIPWSSQLKVGFRRGPGGDATRARAALGAFILNGSAVQLKRYLPGMATLDAINAVRGSLRREIKDIKVENGHKVLLWVSEEAKASVGQLTQLIEEAPPQIGRRWRPLGVKASQSEDTYAWFNKARQGNAFSEEEQVEGAQVLRPIEMHSQEKLESQVVMNFRTLNGNPKYKYECPDCGEVFKDWDACLNHLASTGHLDVSSFAAIEEAKGACKPMSYRCPECGAGFVDWPSCEQHLTDSGHLSWADEKASRKLCLPVAEDEDDNPGHASNEETEEHNSLDDIEANGDIGWSPASAPSTDEVVWQY